MDQVEALVVSQVVESAFHSELNKLAARKARLGSGVRFKSLQKNIAKSIKPRAGQTKQQAAGAVAAAIGRKKYGKKKFQAFSMKGRR
ncbi:hypothetical protein LCGC14_0146730 [marine sediment metagenome]|uniref:Uncharacterized protein n=1 Tax=marine sediment metagenome TaxID=412755 RepID=A0A0F9XHL2_9ZZZZ